MTAKLATPVPVADRPMADPRVDESQPSDTVSAETDAPEQEAPPAKKPRDPVRSLTLGGADHATDTLHLPRCIRSGDALHVTVEYRSASRAGRAARFGTGDRSRRPRQSAREQGKGAVSHRSRALPDRGACGGSEPRTCGSERERRDGGSSFLGGDPGQTEDRTQNEPGARRDRVWTDQGEGPVRIGFHQSSIRNRQGNGGRRSRRGRAGKRPTQVGGRGRGQSAGAPGPHRTRPGTTRPAVYDCDCASRRLHYQSAPVRWAVRQSRAAGAEFRRCG